jgi:hypothetical protein
MLIHFVRAPASPRCGAVGQQHRVDQKAGPGGGGVNGKRSHLTFMNRNPARAGRRRGSSRAGRSPRARGVYRSGMLATRNANSHARRRGGRTLFMKANDVRRTGTPAGIVSCGTITPGAGAAGYGTYARGLAYRHARARGAAHPPSWPHEIG